jgi:hypothetical protein
VRGLRRETSRPSRLSSPGGTARGVHLLPMIATSTCWSMKAISMTA